MSTEGDRDTSPETENVPDDPANSTILGGETTHAAEDAPAKAAAANGTIDQSSHSSEGLTMPSDATACDEPLAIPGAAAPKEPPREPASQQAAKPTSPVTEPASGSLSGDAPAGATKDNSLPSPDGVPAQQETQQPPSQRPAQQPLQPSPQQDSQPAPQPAPQQATQPAPQQTQQPQQPYMIPGFPPFAMPAMPGMPGAPAMMGFPSFSPFMPMQAQPQQGQQTPQPHAQAPHTQQPPSQTPTPVLAAAPAPSQDQEDAKGASGTESPSPSVPYGNGQQQFYCFIPVPSGNPQASFVYQCVPMGPGGVLPNGFAANGMMMPPAAMPAPMPMKAASTPAAPMVANSLLPQKPGAPGAAVQQPQQSAPPQQSQPGQLPQPEQAAQPQVGTVPIAGLPVQLPMSQGTPVYADAANGMRSIAAALTQMKDGATPLMRPARDESELSRKVASAAELRPHICQMRDAWGRQCKRTFTRPYDLYRHQETVHASGVKLFVCDRCGPSSKRFSRQDSLARHMRRMHHIDPIPMRRFSGPVMLSVVGSSETITVTTDGAQRGAAPDESYDTESEASDSRETSAVPEPRVDPTLAVKQSEAQAQPQAQPQAQQQAHQQAQQQAGPAQAQMKLESQPNRDSAQPHQPTQAQSQQTQAQPAQGLPKPKQEPASSEDSSPPVKRLKVEPQPLTAQSA